jgi:phosphopantothenoylcysteine decarboxylase/phosphopantothenate--cysteine ligase
MSALKDKKVLLGVSGGIAAYKAAVLARRLIDAGAEVRVAMTTSATEFISPLTMQAVSGHPVRVDLFDPEAESGMSHIELARWADLVLVAPATAGFMARLTLGLADDLLTTVCLATEAPICIAPAMNRVMWQKTVTQNHLAALKDQGVGIFGPETGDQACGEVGVGRMMEPEQLISEIEKSMSTKRLEGVTVAITAGPTFEAIDPVRGLTNRSSGKMGYAVAQAAKAAGARVILVSGPTALPPPGGARVIDVTTADEMLARVEEILPETDIFVSVAAVSDYRPAESQPEKIKKTSQTITLEMVRNPDILSAVAKSSNRPYTVGFAAETQSPVENARAKLESKHLDLIAVNHISADNPVFGADDNVLTLIGHDTVTELGSGSKTRLASRLMDAIAERYHEKNSATGS